jgi:hypothetical protein
MVDPHSTLTFFEFFLKTAPVLVGGLTAIAGGFLGTWFTQKLITAKENAGLKLKKIEELLSAASECEHWLDEYKNSRIGNDLYSIGYSPLVKVKYLSALHAPELKKEVINLTLAHAEYVNLIATCYIQKIKTGSVPSLFLGEYHEKFLSVSTAVDELVENAVLIIEQRRS